MDCCLVMLRKNNDNHFDDIENLPLQDVISGPKFCPTKIKALTNENAHKTLPRHVFSGMLIKCTVMRILSQVVNRRCFF